MAVLARVESSSDATGAVSNRVATSTVAGLVFGILGFFGLVLAYQLLPRRGKKKRPSPQLQALAPPAPKPIPVFTRLRTSCTTFFTRLASKIRGTKPDSNQPSLTPGTHRPLRSLHLTPERKRERKENRKKFANSLRLSITIPKSPFPVWSPKSSRDPRRLYSKLDDSEAEKSLLKPDSALLSPWSPSELDYPDIPSTPNSPNPLSPFLRGKDQSPISPLPLYTPPPVYSRLTPQRPGFKRVDGADQTQDQVVPKGPSSPFLSPTELEDEHGDGTKSLIEEVQSVLQYTRDWSRENEHRFVISDADDESETGSLYSQPL